MKIIRSKNINYIPASHEDPLNPGCIKKVMVRRGDLSGGYIQMINICKLLPHKSFQAHYHEAMEEIFIILSGKVTISVGRETAQLRKGDIVIVPQKAVHSIKNNGKRSISYIAIGIIKHSGGKTVTVKA